MNKNLTIRELMAPVGDFPKISENTLFYEVITALDKSLHDFQSGKSKQRTLLVEDGDGNILGKITPKDVVKGLEPQYDKIDSFTDNIRYGVPHIVETMKKDYMLWQKPLDDLCRKAGEIKATNMITRPGELQSVDIGASMDQAFHLFVTTGHDSLYVMENDKIVGLLRFSDVYTAIREVVQACKLDSQDH